MSGRSKDLDLSLSGSQISSARSSKSTTKRPSSAAARTTPRTTLNKSDGTLPSSERPSSVDGDRVDYGVDADGSVTPGRIPLSANISRGVSDDFLALFESTGARPKSKQKTPSIRKPLTPNNVSAKSSPFPGSARSNESTPRSSKSKKTTSTLNSEAHSRHSIFLPASDGSGDTTPASTARSHTDNISRGRGTGNIDDLLTPLQYESPDATPRQSNVDQIHNNTEPLDSDRNWMANYNASPRDRKNSIPKNEQNSHANPSKSKSKAKSNNVILRNSKDSERYVHTPRTNQKDINTANNKLPSTSKPPVKLELKTMMNSYQNPTYNVNKTPVNEISEGPSYPNPSSKNSAAVSSASSASIRNAAAEDYIKHVNMAGTKIQRTFRRYSKDKMRLRASEAAMKRLLQSQKQSFVSEREQREGGSESSRSAELRKVQREERARQVRLQAIEEMNRRREEEKRLAAEVAQQELEALKKEGKIGKSTRKGKIVTKSIADRTKEVKASKQSSPRREKVEVQDGHRSSRSSLNTERLSEIPQTAAQNVESDTPLNSSQTPTTLDDLMATLKLLEEDEKLPEIPQSKFGTHAWAEQLTSENVQRLSTDQGNVKSDDGGRQLTDAKLKNIMAFLDEVETSDRLRDIDDTSERTSFVEQIASLPALPGLLVPSAEEIADMEKASAAASEVTSKVLQQRIQLEEKTRTVQMLQKALNQQRELTIRHARETEKEMGKRLDVQKGEYESAIQRHLGFIDQLIDDKKNLSERCEQLVAEMKSMGKKSSDKIHNMQETHDRELAKLKQMLTASEKVKRERWIEEKTKQIKDMTVKGLEPEIQRLIAKHKAELKKLKTIHEAELLQADERAGQRYVSMTEQLRDQLAQEKEAACQRERELGSQRYEKQLQAEEEAYQQARRRLYQEIQEEKERLSESASRQRQEMDKLQRQLEDSNSAAVSAMKQEFDKARKEQDERHQKDLNELKARVEVEKEAWEQNYMKKTESWLLNKERELKDQVKKERDRDIELVISRLEEDGIESREECERAAENRIKRIRDKYEAEMTELERSERQAMEKHNSMKAELMECQGNMERLKVENRQKVQEVCDVKKMSEKLVSERDRVQDVVRQEFADRIVSTEEENRRLKQEMAELRSKHKLELERMRQEMENVNKAKQDEMEAVHERVKQAIAKKEEVVSQVRQQYQAAVKRADHLESLLEQQRKQILSGSKR